MLQDYHRIVVADGGADGLKPGRWLAHPDPRWIDDPGAWAYADSEREAVDSCRRKLSALYLQSPWFATVPAERG